MTPAELHSRILLHELRTILLDESREGTQLPPAYKDLIQSDPHNPSSYLITAEELEEHADPLAELCRIQVELIKEWPLQTEPSPIGLETIVKSDPANHPFYTDHLHARLIGKLVDSKSHWAELTERRWSITLPLYDEPYRDEWRQMRSSCLGRTTRMLTDILRYCALNQGKHVLIHGTSRTHAFHLHSQARNIVRLLTDENLPSYAPFTLLGNTLHFWDNVDRSEFNPPALIRTARCPAVGHVEDYHEIPAYAREHFHGIDSEQEWQISYSPLENAYLGIQTRSPDITFTDHAVQNPQVVDFSVGYGDNYNSYICIGGPYHGQERELHRGSEYLEYAEYPPERIRSLAEIDEIPRPITYQTRTYRLTRFAFPRRNPRKPREGYPPSPDDTHTFREYLVHEGLEEQEAIRLIEGLITQRKLIFHNSR